MTDNLPVIDISELEKPSSLAEIDFACREWGFFQVVGHGIEKTLIDDILEVSRQFFAQPTEQKRKLERDAKNHWGYFDRELTKNRRDWKEIYDFGPADGERLKPRWPTGPFRLHFEPVIRAYYATCMALSMRLLSAIATNLGASHEDLAREFGERHTSFLRLNHYPKLLAQAGEDVDPLGVGEHTDSGVLTLLLQDRHPGLEVKRNGRWHLVEPLAGAIVINVGDMVQVWSNDQYHAAHHRVVANPLCDRYSVPFFLNPSYETTYAPLPTTVSGQRPAHYRRISWREFRTMRAAGDYADLGEEIQISHYRI